MPRRLKHANQLSQQRKTLADSQECLETSQDDNKALDTTLNTLLNPVPPLNTLTSLTCIESELPDRRNGQPLTAEERATIKRVFLEEFSIQANVTRACEKAGISRTAVYAWLDSDQDFALSWNTAEKKANDVLREEAFRRGVTGVSEPIVSMGKLVRDEKTGDPLTVQRYDTPLLLTLMRARMPEYRDSKQVNIEQNTNIHMTQHSLTLDIRGMNSEELAQVRAIADSMKQREQARLDQQAKSKDEHST